jgi:hypothetical protein
MKASQKQNIIPPIFHQASRIRCANVAQGRAPQPSKFQPTITMERKLLLVKGVPSLLQ